MDEQLQKSLVPLWLKVAMSAFTLVLIVIYWHEYGPTNFLWFCDVALFCAVIGLWREDRLLLSMAVLAVTLPELPWNLDYFGRLLTGHHIFGGDPTAYMFDPGYHWFVRGLSYFHLFLPIVVWWGVWRLGYDRRALLAQTVVAWPLMIGAYRLTAREKNMNLVFGPFGPQDVVPPVVYLLLWMIVMPAVVYLPVHLIARWLQRRHANTAVSRRV